MRDDFSTCEHTPRCPALREAPAAAAGQLRMAVNLNWADVLQELARVTVLNQEASSPHLPGPHFSSNPLHSEMTSRHPQPGLSRNAFPPFCWVSSVLKKQMCMCWRPAQGSCGSLSFQAVWNVPRRQPEGKTLPHLHGESKDIVFKPCTSDVFSADNKIK